MESYGIAFILKKLLTWRAIVDIALMAAGLFFLYRTVIRLGTWKIVTGILIALSVFFAASVLDLKGIEWVYSNVSQVAVIALIIIFQPELRKLFERAASMRRVESGDPGLELTGILAEALMTLARQHRGAIVVLPGRELVDEWLDGGYTLDATPSIPLIMSIFDPNSPGHDGALVFQNGRFTRFGTRLPISKSDTLSEAYGTRHHAAMGLSERSDALILMVSEERGAVSSFRQGNFQPVGETRQLVDLILAHWKETATYAFDVRKGLRKGPVLGQLVTSLAVALVFWVFLITGQGEVVEKVLTVPIQFTGSPPGLFLVGDRADEVRAHLAGAASDVNSLTPGQLRVSVDLSGTAAGKQTLAITEQNLRLPKGVQLMDVKPSAIQVTLAAIVEQALKVTPQLVGQLPKGLVIDQVIVFPEKIKVRRPAGSENGADLTLTTTPVYLEGIRQDTHLYGKIIAPPSMQPVDKSWPDVKITIQVKAK